MDNRTSRVCEGPNCARELIGRTTKARFCSQNCQKQALVRARREGRTCARPGCGASLDARTRSATTCSRSCQVAVIRARNPDKIRAQEQASKMRHPVRVAARKKAWYEANRERLNAESLARYYADPQRAAERNRRRYERHGEEIRARVAAYRRANRDKCRAWDAKYRSLRNSESAELIDPVVVFERDSWRCGICHEPIDPQLAWPSPMMASLDHVWPLSRGGLHVWDNVQAAHLRCNKRKHASLPDSAA